MTTSNQAKIKVQIKTKTIRNQAKQETSKATISEARNKQSENQAKRDSAKQETSKVRIK